MTEEQVKRKLLLFSVLMLRVTAALWKTMR
jgi:hypothetical protein